MIGAPEASSAASSAAPSVKGNRYDNSMPRSGSAYVFVRTGNAWTQQADLKASHPDVGDGFGLTVGIFRDRIVIGAPNEDCSIGIHVDGAAVVLPTQLRPMCSIGLAEFGLNRLFSRERYPDGKNTSSKRGSPRQK